ncbi:hypothetical protein MNBD_GAMMA03-581 [hydrothermal vent metagenome]|uniref:Peptidase S8/S53 domain-containing protein n=1 Tax=hydrothermal vent metagenome TaxID=652676 RepID=A0A3B0VS18_9ZZZZ
MSGCGGGDFQNLVNKLFPDEEDTTDSTTNPPYSNYKSVTNAEALIASSNTSAISIGILDDGFNHNHIELSDRTVIGQNYTDSIAINNDIVSGVYGDQGGAWKWTDHGTGVSGLALGKDSGIAPQAEAVTSMNRSLTDFFDATAYFQSFSKDVTGRLDSGADIGTCIQHIYQDDTNSRWFPWCINFGVYHVAKMSELASYDMPVANLSSTISFGHYQTGIDLSFDQTKWDDDSYKVEWDQVNLTEFTDLHFYDYNVSYNYIRNLLSTGELVIVLSAGNDGESLTQRQVLEWQNLKNTSNNPLAQTIVNIFFDPDIDSNGNAIIEDSERGITKGLLFVGALDSQGDRAFYSNYPGSSSEVQARFVVAPGDLSIATPSLGEDGYSLVEGTSNSAPIVAGAIALLKVNHPSKSAREIADAILATALKDIPNYAVDQHGQGLLDVAAADDYLNTN